MMGMMVYSYDSERQRDFDNRQIDICNSRVAFAAENHTLWLVFTYPTNFLGGREKKNLKDVGLKTLKLAKMPIVHLGWLKNYFSGYTGHSD